MTTNYKPIRLGDNVRIRSTPETGPLGLAGQIGQIYGHTIPSVTCIKFIGETQQDLAFNVFFKDRNDAFWFAPELLKFVDHALGTEVQIGSKKWVRTEFGQWKKSKKSAKPKPISPEPIEPLGLLGHLFNAFRKRN
jgi:hypothetical protein